VGVKDDLKKIIEKHLGGAVSSFFLDKSLAIINESADSKESLIAAADRIGKRITLFIDKSLGPRVFESLKAEIEKEPLIHGTKRRRVTFCRKVRIKYDGTYYELESESLSERGMYISTKEPFPARSELEITLSLGFGKQICLNGIVVYGTNALSDASKLAPGMAITFQKVGDKEAEMLRSYIQGALK
jgi:hypothetical protein